MILSLRKDHAGEFLGLAQLDNSARAEFKVYLLPDMTQNEVLKAIKLPTSGTRKSRMMELHLTSIGSVTLRTSPRRSRKICSIPCPAAACCLMQIVCRNLYDSVRNGPEPWVITEALYKNTSIERSVRQHVVKLAARTAACAQPVREPYARGRAVLAQSSLPANPLRG